MPAPTTTTSGRSQREAGRERIGRRRAGTGPCPSPTRGRVTSGHDGRQPADRRLLDEPPGEARADHRLVDEVLRRAPARRARAARPSAREVPVPHGERSSQPGWIAVALRRAVRPGLVEDDVAAAGDAARPRGARAASARLIAAMSSSPRAISSSRARRVDDRPAVAAAAPARRSCRRRPCRTGTPSISRSRASRNDGTLRSVTAVGAPVLHRHARPDEPGRRVEPHDRSRARVTSTIPVSTSTVATPIVPCPHIGSSPRPR